MCMRILFATSSGMYVPVRERDIGRGLCMSMMLVIMDIHDELRAIFFL